MASSTSNNAATTNGAEAPPAPAVLDINPKIHEYYDEPALRMGYSFIQGGVRHLGYWERDTWWPFPIAAALRRMEDKILEGLDCESWNFVEYNSGSRRGICADLV